MDIEGIGNRIKSIRGFDSQDAFAKRIGVHKSTVIRYEKEESYPDAIVIFRICHIYTINPSWLLTGEGDKIWEERVFSLPDFDNAHKELRDRLEGANFTKIAKDYNIPENELIEYVKGNKILDDDKLEILCDRIAFYDFDAVKSSRKINEDLKKSRKKYTSYQQNSATDTDILRDVIEEVEEYTTQNNIKLQADKKAELISIIYEEIMEDKEKHSLLKERTARLFKLVS